MVDEKAELYEARAIMGLELERRIQLEMTVRRIGSLLQRDEIAARWMRSCCIPLSAGLRILGFLPDGSETPGWASPRWPLLPVVEDRYVVDTDALNMVATLVS